jgi:hypothetical protein
MALRRALECNGLITSTMNYNSSEGAGMRHLILTVSLLLIAGSLAAQQDPAQRRSEQVPGWVPVKKVCGRVRIVERGVFVPAPKKELHLYEAKWRKPCCEDLKVAGTRTTSENGDFDFGDIGLVGTG